MAVVNPTRADTETGTVITWANLQIGDTGRLADTGDLEFNKSIHVAGAGTAQITRSNDGVNFVNIAATQAGGTIVDSQTAAKFFAVGAVTVGACTVMLASRKLIIHT
jgi:hypothetical protein